MVLMLHHQSIIHYRPTTKPNYPIYIDRQKQSPQPPHLHSNHHRNKGNKHVHRYHVFFPPTPYQPRLQYPGPAAPSLRPHHQAQILDVPAIRLFAEKMINHQFYIPPILMSRITSHCHDRRTIQTDPNPAVKNLQIRL